MGEEEGVCGPVRVHGGQEAFVGEGEPGKAGAATQRQVAAVHLALQRHIPHRVLQRLRKRERSYELVKREWNKLQNVRFFLTRYIWDITIDR